MLSRLRWLQYLGIDKWLSQWPVGVKVGPLADGAFALSSVMAAVGCGSGNGYSNYKLVTYCQRSGSCEEARSNDQAFIDQINADCKANGDTTSNVGPQNKWGSCAHEESNGVEIVYLYPGGSSSVTTRSSSKQIARNNLASTCAPTRSIIMASWARIPSPPPRRSSPRRRGCSVVKSDGS